MSFVLLGILNAQAAGGAAVDSDFDLIQSEILDATTSSVTFDVSGLSSDYQHLQLRVSSRDGRAVTANFLEMEFNGDSGSSYTSHKMDGDGTSVTGVAYTGLGYLRLAVQPSANANANVFGVSITDILNAFSTTRNKTTRTLGGYYNGSPQEAALVGGLYQSNSAITSILLRPQSGSFVANTRLSLYGYRKAA